ncbi:eCIS core domain-containing protein, partial [Streptomyces sp. NPDC001415]
GADFSDVRIHNDSAAKASAAEVGARAYTSGSHVVIGDGGADKHTLAHELTHVIQQRQGPVAGTDNGSGLKVSDPSDRFEREAEANATRVMSGPVPEAAVTAQRSVTADGSVAAQRSVAAPASAVPSVQRRGDNPYAKAVDHDGWTTTAHHIVAHATLTGALNRLSDAEQLEVLTSSVPKELSKEMLANLKVAVPENENTPQYRSALRQRLASTDNPNTDTEYGISFLDIRHSFFEWQAGNQFVGPNTSIRAEPSANGDDIDTDGKYFSPLKTKQFAELTGLGDRLKQPGIENDETVKTLKGILALTKNQKVADFDPSKWTEVDNGMTVDELAADQHLDRAHITGYSFFKLLAADVRAGRYHDFLPAATGGGYEYYGRALTGAQTRGEFVYIPYLTRETAPPKEGKGARPRQTLAEYCVAQKVPTSTFLPRELYNPTRKPMKK